MCFPKFKIYICLLFSSIYVKALSLYYMYYLSPEAAVVVPVAAVSPADKKGEQKIFNHMG